MGHRALTFFLCLAAVSIQLTHGANWALLVAGSNDYTNYRHQADICHAYHIMRNHGIPESNIVTMMFDDIAYNKENPFKGNIINRPNGPNVYPGVVIDYKGYEVKSDVFLAVLSGDEEKVKKLTGHKGKVIKSGPNDHVFVNFADHGGPGILSFPSGIVLFANVLESTLENMYKKKSYKKLVLYVEACESGSIFYNLLRKDISVFATTAANRSQSSYACYYDEKRQTYLGDVYSVNWMQDSDKENLQNETLQMQFRITREETNTSQVMEFGDLSISQMTVAEFQGNQAAKVSMGTSPAPPHPTADAVPARDATLHILQHRLNAVRTPQERREVAKKLSDLLEHNAQIDELFKGIVDWLQKRAAVTDGKDGVVKFRSELSYQALKNGVQAITQWNCYEHVVSTLMYSCPKMKLSQNYYALGQLYMLVNLCEREYPTYALATAVMASADHNHQLCRAT